MTIQARTQYEATVGDTTLILDRRDKAVTIHEYWGDDYFTLSDPDGIDAAIELLHAVKSETENAAASARRLVEAFQPHEEIIAVTEATA